MPRQPLIEYERRQIQRIAAWKGRRPGPVGRTIGFLTRPFDRLLATVLPAHEAEKMLVELNRAADWKVGHDLIRREAGIDDLSQLRTGALEHCDRLETQIELSAAAVVTTESLLAGAGGLATELAALPAEVLLALRSIHRIAGCYGYELHGERDRALVLSIVALSMVEEPALRQRWIDSLLSPEQGNAAGNGADAPQLERTLEADIRGEARDDALEEVGTSLLEQKLGESIPFLGEAIGVVLDNTFVREIEVAAHHVFQERWLRDNGKIDSIAPQQSSTNWAEELRTGLSQTAYVTGYSVGFGVTFPVLLVSKLVVMAVPLPIVEGLTEGAAAANGKVAEWRAGANGRTPRPSPAESRAATPVPTIV